MGNAKPRRLDSKELSNNGKTVTITGINASSGQKVILTLLDRTVPAVGSYTFSIVGDADGPGVSKNASSAVEKAFVSDPPGVVTETGTLELAPQHAEENITGTINLRYTLGEDLKKGTVVFMLPPEISAATTDTVQVGSGKVLALVPAEIDEATHRVSVREIDAVRGETVVLNLVNKKIPPRGQVEGEYIFRASADADGDLRGKKTTPGILESGEARVFIADRGPVPTVNGVLEIAPSKALQKIDSSVTLRYTPGEDLRNGTVIFKLPTEIRGKATQDKIIIGKQEETVLQEEQIQNEGQTIKLTGVTTNLGDTIVLTLVNRTLPIVGSYSVSVSADADGTERVKGSSSGTGQEAKTLVTERKKTEAGILELTPLNATEGTETTLKLSYTLGDNVQNGVVSFRLPALIKAVETVDTFQIEGEDEKQLYSSQIGDSGMMVTLNIVKADAGKKVTLSLKNKTLPKPGTYTFSASADADGTLEDYSPSSDLSEQKSLSINPVPTATKGGSLKIVDDFLPQSITRTIRLAYYAGENLTKGTVIFTLPDPFCAEDLKDTVQIGTTGSRLLLPAEISDNGKTITLQNVTINPTSPVTLNLLNKSLPLAGSYSFKVSADADGYQPNKTPSSGVEYEVRNLTVTRSTQSGSMEILSDRPEVNTPLTMTVSYTLAEEFKDGKVTFKLPEFLKAVVDKDQYQILDAEEKPLSSTLLSNDGKTVTITGISGAAGQKVTLLLVDKLIPLTGTYPISALVDADGTAQALTESRELKQSFLTYQAPLQTQSGVLKVTPESAEERTNQDIQIMYTAGEKLQNGTVVFSLPKELMAVKDEDKYIISNGQPEGLASEQISVEENTVTINDVTLETGETLTIILGDKQTPTLGEYVFGVKADADGSERVKTYSSGEGAEKQSFKTELPQTLSGVLEITPAQAEENTEKNFTLRYTLGEDYSLGRVQFELPDLFLVNTVTDTVQLPNGDIKSISPEQIITQDGRAVLIMDINGKIGEKVTLILKNKKIPIAGYYNFKASGDADGAQQVKGFSSGQGQEEGSFNSSLGPKATTAGILSLAPDTAVQNSRVDIQLDYTLGEDFKNGEFVFNLPQGIQPEITDTWGTSTSTSLALTSEQISTDKNTITLKDINATLGQKVTLNLYSKQVPLAGSYPVSVIADADGGNRLKTPSPGTQEELKSFIATIPKTLSGQLSSSPEYALEKTDNQTLNLSYSLGEDFTNGTVIFSLPQELVVDASDQLFIGNTQVQGVVGDNGQRVTLNKVSGKAEDLITLTLVNKMIPIAGKYTFSVNADADGVGKEHDLSLGEGLEMITFSADRPAIPTGGTLKVTPETAVEGTMNSNIVLTFTLKDYFQKGTLTFKLPTELSANLLDGVSNSINRSQIKLLPEQISDEGRMVVIKDIQVPASGYVTFFLNKKMIPKEGDYTISVIADADGAGHVKSESPEIFQIFICTK